MANASQKLKPIRLFVSKIKKNVMWFFNAILTIGKNGNVVENCDLILTPGTKGKLTILKSL
jgi:hypothetical protein